MDPGSLQELAVEAEDILESYLTEAEREEVFSNFKDISSQVRWGAVSEEVFGGLLDDVYDLVFGVGVLGDTKFSKNDTWYLATDAEKELYEDKDPKGMHRRHLLLLWMTRKLLGVLKTKVNQGLLDVPILDDEEESELRGLQDYYESAGEEPELVACLERGKPDLPSIKDIDLSAEGDCLQGGAHIRVVVRHRRRDNQVLTEQYCKDCRKVVSSVIRGSEEKADEPCECEAAVWIPGKEGQEAVCSKCKEPIENPETFQWRNAGLEPFGDDPSQDEVVTLCSEY